MFKDLFTAGGAGLKTSLSEMDKKCLSGYNIVLIIFKGIKEISMTTTKLSFNLSRLWKYYKEGKFGIVSAFGDYPKKVNRERSDKLKKMVRDLGYGYKEIQGVWKGEAGTVFEYPLFIPHLTPQDAKVIGKEFEQEAVIFAETPEEVTLWDTKNDKLIDKFKKLQTSQGEEVWESYSDLKGKKFKFSGVEWVFPFPDPEKYSSMKCFIAMAEESYFKEKHSDFRDKDRTEIVILTKERLGGAK